MKILQIDFDKDSNCRFCVLDTEQRQPTSYHGLEKDSPSFAKVLSRVDKYRLDHPEINAFLVSANSLGLGVGDMLIAKTQLPVFPYHQYKQ